MSEVQDLFAEARKHLGKMETSIRLTTFCTRKAGEYAMLSATYANATASIVTEITEGYYGNSRLPRTS